ncbi:MAG: GIY-YIG nuclease family protein [Fidelibacterota bacterium]
MVLVYVLQSKSKSRRYVGITNDLNRRLQEHRSEKSTVHRLLGDFDLLLTEEYPDHKSARTREKFLKSGKGREYLNKFIGRDTP